MTILVERDNIGIFGKMNAGKSSVMNLLTQQETSIVDSKPGTTADTKITLQEIHGIGPVKLYDTAGADEKNLLGDKKRKKILADLKECDLVIIVIDPSSKGFETEQLLLETARELDKQIFIVYNIFGVEESIDHVINNLTLLKFYKSITIKAIDEKYRKPLIEFILENFESKKHKMELFPFLNKEEFYVLNIPMDEETPHGRYLRPQAMSEEYITRNWAYPVSYRMDLGLGRSKNVEESEKEKNRFLKFIDSFGKRPHAIITDSQAMDLMHKWVPKEIMLTTFSITMINYFSRGRLGLFADGIKAIDKLKKGDRVLIVEACNHSRVSEDIGTVQIPNYFKKLMPEVVIEHNFGREFQENKTLEKYKLIIHCGGCMISSQKLMARIRDLESVGVPFTNYGIFLSYIQGQKALNRVLEPWL